MVDLPGFLRAMPAGGFLLDADGRFLAVATYLVRTLGRSEAELTALRFHDLFPEPRLAPFYLRASADMVVEDEIRLRGPDDRIFPALLGLARVDPSGQSGGAVYVGSLTDVSRRRLRESRLARRQRHAAVGLIAAGFTRDVLALVETLGARARNARGDADRAVTFADDAVDELGRLAERCRALIGFGRPRSQVWRCVRLEAVIERVLTLIDPDLRGRGITLTRRFADDVPPTLMNDALVEETLLTLIVNASDAIGGRRDGTITVETELEDGPGGNVIVRVRDDGRGIVAADRARMFQPFFTTKLGPDGEPLGSGLGLALAQEVCHEHGGTIGFETRAGEGTCFTVRLPVREERRQLRVPVDAPRRLLDHVERRRRVLVIDDEAGMRDLFPIILRDHEVTVAGSSREGVSLASDGAFDLIFLDLDIEQSPTGHEALELLAPVAGRAHVAVVTAAADDARLEAVRERVDTVLLKPVRLEEVLGLVEPTVPDA